MARCFFVVIVLILALSPSQEEIHNTTGGDAGYTFWESRAGEINVCEGSNATFLWNYNSSTPSFALIINKDTGRQLKELLSKHIHAANIFDSRIVEYGNAGFVLRNVTLEDSGKYETTVYFQTDPRHLTDNATLNVHVDCPGNASPKLVTFRVEIPRVSMYLEYNFTCLCSFQNGSLHYGPILKQPHWFKSGNGAQMPFPNMAKCKATLMTGVVCEINLDFHGAITQQDPNSVVNVTRTVTVCTGDNALLRWEYGTAGQGDVSVVQLVRLDGENVTVYLTQVLGARPYLSQHRTEPVGKQYIRILNVSSSDAGIYQSITLYKSEQRAKMNTLLSVLPPEECPPKHAFRNPTIYTRLTRDEASAYIIHGTVCIPPDEQVQIGVKIPLSVSPENCSISVGTVTLGCGNITDDTGIAWTIFHTPASRNLTLNVTMRHKVREISSINYTLEITDVPKTKNCTLNLRTDKKGNTSHSIAIIIPVIGNLLFACMIIALMIAMRRRVCLCMYNCISYIHGHITFFMITPTSNTEEQHELLPKGPTSCESGVQIRIFGNLGNKEERVILLLGPRGAGKSTFLKMVVNCIYTFEFEEHKSSHSEPGDIIIHVFNHQKLFSLIIIDIPGIDNFKDQRFVQDVIVNIENMLMATGKEDMKRIVKRLDCLCIVSRTDTFSPNERLVICQLLEPFGKNIADHIFSIHTHDVTNEQNEQSKLAIVSIDRDSFKKRICLKGTIPIGNDACSVNSCKTLSLEEFCKFLKTNEANHCSIKTTHELLTYRKELRGSLDKITRLTTDLDPIYRKFKNDLRKMWTTGIDKDIKQLEKQIKGEIKEKYDSQVQHLKSVREKVGEIGKKAFIFLSDILTNELLLSFRDGDPETEPRYFNLPVGHLEIILSTQNDEPEGFIYLRKVEICLSKCRSGNLINLDDMNSGDELAQYGSVESEISRDSNIVNTQIVDDIDANDDKPEQKE